MRAVVRAVVGAGCLFAVLAACVGGPGTPPNDGLGGSGQDGVVEGAPPVNSGNRGNDDDEGDTPGEPPPNNESIRARDFGRQCNTDEDCVAVFDGRACTACKCPSVAIAKSEQARYDAELARLSVGCPAIAGDCAPCAQVQAGCHPERKECEIGVTSNPPPDGGGG